MENYKNMFILRKINYQISRVITDEVYKSKPITELELKYQHDLLDISGIPLHFPHFNPPLFPQRSR